MKYIHFNNPIEYYGQKVKWLGGVEYVEDQGDIQLIHLQRETLAVNTENMEKLTDEQPESMSDLAEPFPQR